MPPRIRTRASKALKENINVSENKLRIAKYNTKPPRKALADKTNSASDDTSIEIPTKSKKTIPNSSKTVSKENAVKKKNTTSKQNSKPKINSQQKENSEPADEVRPRRDRRLPPRFVENPVFNNLSNNKDNQNVTLNSSTNDSKVVSTPAKNISCSKSDQPEPSPFRTPKTDTSLLANRPRRICRLPSRFEDHSISPNKYISIQPTNASTPIQKSKIKPPVPIQGKENVNIKRTTQEEGKDSENKQAPIVVLTRLTKIDALLKTPIDNLSDKSSPDSNNNAKSRSTRVKKINKKQPVNENKSPVKKAQSKTKKIQASVNVSPFAVKKIKSPGSRLQSSITEYLSSITMIKSPATKLKSSMNKSQSSVKRISPTTKSKRIDKNLSFKVLGGKKNSQSSENKDQDVYEFTFDPNEEPQPQKKKRKKSVTKKPPAPKPKKAVYKSAYDQNISKALAALKNVIKPAATVAAEVPKLTPITENNEKLADNVQQTIVTNNVNTTQNTNTQVQIDKSNNVALDDNGKISVHENNYPSIRVEDIAADIEPSVDHHDDINYSPVNSPRQNESVNAKIPTNVGEAAESSLHNNNPLNLAEELSFFDDQPVASSSMNMSVKHPQASPWRVEFDRLPIKWAVNAYVKPNMTPAVESSFISSEDTNKKRHVYTNILQETNDALQEIVGNTPNLKQTSIISFIKEMAEKSARKKRGRSVSPFKHVIDELDSNKNKQQSKNANSNNKEVVVTNTSEEVSGSTNDISSEKDISKEKRINRKRKNDDKVCDRPAKSPRKQKDKDVTYFGFDESENQDTENVSPIKSDNNPRGRSLRSKSRAILQEINGPTRAALPVAAKSKTVPSSEAANKVYSELKSAADAPLFPENNVENNVTNVEDPALNEDSQSVHLFEDIELVHHFKPLRKSYGPGGKPKKVQFRKLSTSDSDTQEAVVDEQNESSDYDDLGDLTFEIPNVEEKKKMKKKKPKKLISKKEEQEAEAWAANFNSMCEDIEEFPLLVE